MFEEDDGGPLRRGLAGGNSSYFSETALSLFEQECNADCQGKSFLGQMTYCFAFFADRPTFGSSLSLKKNLFLKKKRGLSYGYNILLEAPVLGKCHLMEETQM